MLRSLYSAISGLKNHQIKMDVIGNNISNVNTTGFKRSRVTFSTMLSQTMKGAGSPSDNQGGTNPSQIGLGTMLTSIDQIMTPGSSQSTGKDTDMMIQGSGFFVLQNNGQTVYSRSGAFSLDKNGYLIEPGTGARIQGYTWGVDDSTEAKFDNASLGPIRFALGDVYPGDLNLPAATPKSYTDGTGFAAGSPGVEAELTDPALVGAGNVTIEGMTKVDANPGVGEFTFDPETGTFTFIETFATPTAAASVNISYVSAAAPESVDLPNLKATVLYPPKTGATVYLNNLAYKPAAGDTPGDGEYVVSEANGKYEITFGANDSSGTGTDLSGTPKVGFDTGSPRTLTSYSVDQSGTITGVYSDGENSTTHRIAQVAIASFANDAGLMNLGNSFYAASNNSGLAVVGAAGVDGRGTIVPSAVEMSNVDLSQEFTDMIVTQRGFQANSRVITVSDSLLQELIDLKRG